MTVDDDEPGPVLQPQLLTRDERVELMVRIAEGTSDDEDPSDDRVAADAIRRVAGADQRLIHRALRHYDEGPYSDPEDFLSVRASFRIHLALDSTYQLPIERAHWYEREHLVFTLIERAGDLAVDGTWQDLPVAIENLRTAAGEDVGILERAKAELEEEPEEDREPDQVIALMLLGAAVGEPITSGSLAAVAEELGFDQYSTFARAARSSRTAGWQILCERDPALLSWAGKAVAIRNVHDPRERAHRREHVTDGLQSVLGPNSGRADPVLASGLALSIASLELLGLASPTGSTAV